MCGIAGLADLTGSVDRQLLEVMTGTLRHRGPDAGGLWAEGNVGLGHRRLSIIDTSASANQPMRSEDGSVVVTYNGEIYNFQRLRGELEAAGHRFRTRCDTEVIVHAWEEYGARSVERFRGMFAFAVYDQPRHLLFLARDRLGQKPLYYSISDRGLSFASEIKALRRVPWVGQELDLQGLGEYATYGYTLGARTIYRDISRLLPGHTLTLSLGGEVLEPKLECYWDVRPEPDEQLSEEDWLDQLDQVLSEAVRLRMISDVPLGAFLSGGVDSSLVVAYMAKHSPGRVKTFTMGFREAGYDEATEAGAVAEHFGTDHQTELVTPDAVSDLETLIETYDEPFADESAIPTFHLSRLTRQQVKVALSGDGGDESFLGYERYFQSQMLDRAGRMLTPLGRRLLDMTSRRLPTSSRLRLPLQRVARSRFLLYHHAMGYADEFLQLLRPEIRSQLSTEDGGMARDFHRYEGLGLLARYAYTDLKNYLPDDILVKVDRASMHHSLEVRCPLLDHKVVETAARIPIQMKHKGGAGKWILRRLLHRHLPAELVERPKRGFGVPLPAWFRGELAPMLERMVADREHPMWRYFDLDVIAQRLAYHLQGKRDQHVSLWRALFFYRWAEKHLGSPG